MVWAEHTELFFESQEFFLKILSTDLNNIGLRYFVCIEILFEVLWVNYQTIGIRRLDSRL